MDATEEAGSPAPAEEREALRRARILLGLSRPREALAALQEAVLAEPGDEAGWCLVAEAFAVLGERVHCLRAAEYALRAHPFDTAAHVWRIRALLDLAREKEALAAAREARELTHYDPAIPRLLVRALLACGQHGEALAELEPLIAQSPDDLEIACLRGRLAQAQGDDDAAISCFRWAAEHDRDCEDAWVGLAELRRKQGHRLDAAHCYYEASRCNPQEPSYRSRGVEQLDQLVEQRLGILPSVYYTFMLLIGGVFCFYQPLLIPVLVLLLAWGGKALGRWTLNGVLRTLEPEVGAYYRRVFPLQKAQDAKDGRIGCLMLIGIVAMGALLVEWTRRGLWEVTLQVTVITALSLPLVWSRLAPHRRTPKPEPPLFRFPDDLPSAGEPPFPAPAADPEEIAWTQLRSGEVAAARETARQLLTVDPEDTSLLRLYSLASLAAGDAEAGLAAAYQARERDPEAPQLRALVWLQLTAAGRLDEAIREAEADEHDPEAALSLLVEEIGLLEAAGATEAAQAGTRLVQELAPASPQAWKLVGDAAMREERWPEAEAAYRQAVALEPETTFYLSHLAALLARQHRYREAWRIWNQVLKLDPSAEWVVANLESQLGWALIVTGMGLALLLAVAAMLPTVLGATRNGWMPWATFAGPPLIGLLCAALHGPWRRVIGPTLPPHGGGDVSARALPAGLVSGLILLPAHAVQAWTEISVHPALLAVRWQGAATITFLAVYAVVGALRSIKVERG